jgi:hypothetical protein
VTGDTLLGRWRAVLTTPPEGSLTPAVAVPRSVPTTRTHRALAPDGRRGRPLHGAGTGRGLWGPSATAPASTSRRDCAPQVARPCGPIARENLRVTRESAPRIRRPQAALTGCAGYASDGW